MPQASGAGQHVEPGRDRGGRVRVPDRVRFQRAGHRLVIATGMMKGSGIFMHDSTADRPAPEFAGINTVHTGGAHAGYLLLPRIPRR